MHAGLFATAEREKHMFTYKTFYHIHGCDKRPKLSVISVRGALAVNL